MQDRHSGCRRREEGEEDGFQQAAAISSRQAMFHPSVAKSSDSTSVRVESGNHFEEAEVKSLMRRWQLP